MLFAQVDITNDLSLNLGTGSLASDHDSEGSSRRLLLILPELLLESHGNGWWGPSGEGHLPHWVKD